MSKGCDFFSADYATARDRFRIAGKKTGAVLHHIALDARGPSEEPLTVDIAWLGAPQPRRVLLHSSGIHGVEAFAGAAIQLALLDAPPALPADAALILVHVLNPWGMAWLRRVNEHNVDLNRNFLLNDQPWSGAPPLYRTLNGLLNPPSVPKIDAFLLRAAWLIARHGMHPLKQAIVQGQYDFPRGLFYGGSTLEQSPAKYLQWLKHHLSDVEHIFAIDVHTGLGAHGSQMLIPEATNHTSRDELAKQLEQPLTNVFSGDSAAYTVRGGIGAAVASTLSNARIDFLTQEFGTCSPLQVVSALRDENRWHHCGTGVLDHPSKMRLLEALCPASTQWREQTIESGVDMVRIAIRQTLNPSN